MNENSNINETAAFGNALLGAVSPEWQSTWTTCKCGESVELKWIANKAWKEHNCKCGTNIRVNRGSMIVERGRNCA